MSDCTVKFTQIYDQYFNYCLGGGFATYFFQNLIPEEREKLITTGYAFNKDITYPAYQTNHYFYFVFDHLRHINETLAGIFSSDNKEFNQILRPFLHEFMYSSVYVLYSEDFKKYELGTAEILASHLGQDPVEKIQKSYPDCNFRLLRRVAKGNGEFRWDAILSGVEGIDLYPFLDSEIPMTWKEPIRFSFNEGFYFSRLFHIFNEYETLLQIYKRLMIGLPKVGDINAEDINAVQSKIKQLQKTEIFTHSVLAKPEEAATINNSKLFELMPHLTTYYDLIHANLNDQLARLGIAGDDSTKAERITTGENFRALQPNMAFQQSILNELENFTFRINKHFSQSVKFTNSLAPNEQGIPIAGEPNTNDNENIKD